MVGAAVASAVAGASVVSSAASAPPSRAVASVARAASPPRGRSEAYPAPRLGNLPAGVASCVTQDANDPRLAVGRIECREADEPGAGPVLEAQVGREASAMAAAKLRLGEALEALGALPDRIIEPFS